MCNISHCLLTSAIQTRIYGVDGHMLPYNLSGSYSSYLPSFSCADVFWKLQPECKFYCKCHDEQLHLINPKDDMIEKTGKVLIIRRIQVILY